jgi:ligand-binding sensor domain-containing protein
MMKHIYSLFLVLVFCVFCKGQNKKDLTKDNAKSVTKEEITFGPNTITRHVTQDRNGNIWIASWDGIFRYNGTSFTNITSKVSTARFFSVLEDRKGNMWFGSVGSGVYRYDGKSFQNFTTNDGLVNNDIVSIYEDRAGNIWFGGYGGASRYDGKSFQNYIIDGDSMTEDRTGRTFPDTPPLEVNSIIEDKKGKFWFGTRNKTFVYDARLPDVQGKTFTVFTHDNIPFTNVRSIIEDKRENIWFGGPDGLWRYDGHTFTNFTHKFVGYVYEDKKGNIWTSSEKDKHRGWALSRYDGAALSDETVEVTEITSSKKLIFGISEANNGHIWFGTLDGVCRYDGTTVTSY